MKKTCYFFLSVITLSLPQISASASELSGESLRDLVTRNFPKKNVFIGATTGWEKMDKAHRRILRREFSYTTPENDFKLSRLCPKPGLWSEKGIATLKNWIKYCEQNNTILRAHGGISPQCSNWDKDDKRTKQELTQHLDEFMRVYCALLNKNSHVIKWLDVVNETVSGKKWFGPKEGIARWENPWPKIGFDQSHPLKAPLYIKRAFELANKYAPKIKLIINQHGQLLKTDWEKIKGLVGYLRAAGLRVDGIGWQAHVDVAWEQVEGNQEKLASLIAWAHANELEFHITEANVWLKGKDKDFEAQAKTFAKILEILLRHRHSGIVGWNTWNISDASSWQKHIKLKGCIFDGKMQPKPAYFALRELLQNPPPPNSK